VADDSWGGSVVQVDSTRKRGVLLEAVQVLADLDLSINKAYISSDGAALRGLRRARRHGVQRGGGPRVDAPGPPRLRGVPPRRGRRRRPCAAHPRTRRPPPPLAHGRGPGPGPGRPRVPDAGRVRRRLGRARVLRGHRLRRVEAALGYGFLFVFFFFSSMILGLKLKLCE